MLKIVTITGADDSVAPNDLAKISSQYPFVEWGILVSRKHYGANRFPSRGWIKDLVTVKKENPEMKLSLHLCGAYVRELTEGLAFCVSELRGAWKIFDRVQLNFHAIKHQTAPTLTIFIKSYRDKEFIFQYDEVNAEVIEYAKRSFAGNISVLYDLSGGRGILPDKWERPIKDIKTGYAGRAESTLETEVVLNNGKRIKKGEKVITAMHPICGRIMQPKCQ